MRETLEQVKKDSRKKKRKKVNEEHENSKRKKVEETDAKPSNDEKKDDGKNKKEKSAKTIKKDGKDVKEEKMVQKYNDKNVSHNLCHEAPENIIPTSVKISSNVMLMSKTVEAPESKGLTYEYAALTFARRQKNGQPFEFHLPLGLAPTIIEGIQLIMKDNAKFFVKKSL
jgi:hypothetical protein